MESLKAIRYLLVNDAAVNAVVNNRVYAFTLPQEKDMPAIVLSIVGNQPYDTKDGSSEIDRVRMQITAVGRTQSQCIDLSRKIRNAIDHSAYSTSVGVRIEGIRFESQTSLYEFERNVPMVANDYVLRVVEGVELVNPDFTFVGRYANDEAAIADGNATGDLYVLTIGNDYAMPGLLKRIGFSGADYYASDVDAILGGKLSGEHYYLSLDNLAAMIGGAVKRIGLTGAANYDSDAEAISGGLAVGDLYYLSSNNLYGVPEGLIKIIEA